MSIHRTLSKFYLALFFLISINTFSLKAQEQTDPSIRFSSATLIDSENLPYWIWANQRGKYNRSATNYLIDFTSFSKSISVGDFDFTGNVDFTANLSSTNTVYFSQAYVRAKYGGFELWGGRFYRQQGYNDGELGIGSMLISRHANAIPGIDFRSDGFLEVPYTKGYFDYKFSIGHYWFEDDRFVDNVWLHSKELYLRLNIGKYSVGAGIVHNVMWGGKSPIFGDLSSNISDFFRIFVSASANKNNNSTSEINNALGNTVAGYDYQMSWEDENFELHASRLFFIEDQPAAHHRSFWDGQWTGDILFKKSEFLKHIRYDYIYTIRQDGFGNQPGGRSNYYGHGIYKSGWAYEEKVLGNPLIIFDHDADSTINNMLVGQSLSTRYTIDDHIEIKTAFTYVRNYGKCVDYKSPEGFGCRGSIEKDIPLDIKPREPQKREEYQIYSSMKYILPKRNDISLELAVGYDIREQRKDRFGMLFSIRYQLSELFKP